MSSICSKCNKNAESPIKCDGICGKKFHLDCVGVSRSVWKYVNDVSNLKWLCDACNENSKFMCAINQKIEDLYMLFDQQMIDQKTATETVIIEIKNCCDNLKMNSTENGNPVVKVKTVPKNKTFADVLKNKMFEPIVVIKPTTNGQNSDVTKQYVQQKIDPAVVPVYDMKTVANGDVIVRCKNKQDLDNCKSKIQQQLGGDYNVVVPKVRCPALKIVGLSVLPTEDELVEKMMAQNAFVSQKAKIEVTELKMKNEKIFATVRCDGATYGELMKHGKIAIGWDRCRVYEYVNVMRCYKCAGFHHKAADCRNQMACPKCAGDHELTKCETNRKCCINCKTMNEKLNLNMDISHSAWNRECPIYARKLKSVISNTNYL
jgi:hypothetical protein